MAKETLKPQLEPILLFRPHCGKPTAPTTPEEITKVIASAIAGTDTEAGATRCDIHHFIDLSDEYTIETIIENESDRCNVGVVCSECVDAQTVSATLLKCSEDRNFAERLQALSIITGFTYEDDGAGNYVSYRSIGGRACPFFDVMIMKCDPSTQKIVSSKIFYKARIDEGSSIITDCTKFSRTQEFANTELTFSVPRGSCVYESVAGEDIADLIKEICDKTPQDVIDALGSETAWLTALTTEKKPTEKKTETASK